MAENQNYEVIQEGEDIILRINYEDSPQLPSLEDNEIVMGRTIEILIEVGVVTKIIFIQKRDYEYDYQQTQLLSEVAKLYQIGRAHV